MLDEVRSHTLAADADVLKLFFQCGDILGDLVRESRDGIEHDSARNAPVLAQLDALLGTDGEAAPAEEEVEFQPMTLSLDLPGLDDAAPPLDLDEPGEPVWSITFQPEATLYSTGNEPPLFLFRALRDLGEIEVTCQSADLPSLDALDAEQSYLKWDITLRTGDGEEAIREAFEFVEGGLCLLEISEGNAEPAGGATLPPLGGDLPDLPPLDANLPPPVTAPEPAPPPPCKAPPPNPLPPRQHQRQPPRWRMQNQPSLRKPRPPPPWPPHPPAPPYGSTSTGSTAWSTWSVRS